MFADAEAFSGFSVDDLDVATRFYGETLGLGIEEIDRQNGLCGLKIKGSRDVLVYQSPMHRPASYTVLNFPVDDVEAAVDELMERGVEFQRYDGFDQDAKGILHGKPTIAWFTDPAGNVLSVVGK